MYIMRIFIIYYGDKIKGNKMTEHATFFVEVRNAFIFIPKTEKEATWKTKE